MKRLLMILSVFAFSTVAALANTVNLAWDRNTETDVTGYNVYRGTMAGGPYNKVNAVLVPQSAAPTYSDTTPTNTTFFYVVRAVNMSGLESANSNEVVANPIPPAPPRNLHIVSLIANVNLLVDAKIVASGPPPLFYTLPRQTPPRTVPLSVTVAP